MRLLRAADADEGIGAVLSVAMRGGEPQAISLVMHANEREGFAARANALAEMGAQAALIPDAMDDKAIIGRLLGYPRDAVAAHIAKGGEEWTADAADAVDARVAALGEAALPWRREAPSVLARMVR